jgi:WD40 repeat protein
VQNTQAIVPHRKCEGHIEWVMNIIHLQREQWMMTCSWDGSLRVWDVERGKQIGEDWRDDGAGMRSIVSGREEST